MEPAFVADLFDEVGKVFGDVLEGFEGHRIDTSTFSLFMKLPALALSLGLPRRPIEPIRPLAASVSW
ncbi:hypothetical protein ABIE76_001244 [Sinorhizobium fredii]